MTLIKYMTELADSSAACDIVPRRASDNELPGANVNAEVAYRGTDENEVVERFDPFFYCSVYPDVAVSGIDPLVHYIAHGRTEGRMPNADSIEGFDPEFYTSTYPDVLATGMDPLTHYVNHGRAEGRRRNASIMEEFDPDFYRSVYPDVTVAGIDPLTHYIAFGKNEGRWANAKGIEDFDPEFYRLAYPDAIANGMDPLKHYVVHGHSEGRLHRPLNTSTFMVRDAACAELLNTEALDHVFSLLYPECELPLLGERKRYVVLMFSPERYRGQVGEVAIGWTRLRLLLHFAIYGMPDGISPGPLFDEEHYQSIVFDKGVHFKSNGESTFEHWLSYGVKNQISPSPLFVEADYLNLNPELAGWTGWLFDHFLVHGINEGRPFLSGITLANPPTSVLHRPPRTGARILFDTSGTSLNSKTMLSTTAKFANLQKSDLSADIFRRASEFEPKIGALNNFIGRSYLPPFHDGGYQEFEQIWALVSRHQFRAIVFVPFCKLGGADYVAGILTRTLSNLIRPIVIRTDQSEWARPDWFPDDVITLDLSVFFRHISEDLSVRILYEIVRLSKASDIFNVNSLLAFKLYVRYGRQMKTFTQLHAYYFCADRNKDGSQIGYPVDYFSNIFDHLTSAMIDNDTLANELRSRYQLDADLSRKLVTLYTPASEYAPINEKAKLAKKVAFGAGSDGSVAPPVIFWGGRLDKQKRFDIVVDMARMMPDVTFKCWGKAVLDASPDLSNLPKNVFVHPPFATLFDLPLDETLGWLYTSSWDGLPTILIEVARLGIPIVASAVGGIPELIDHTTGWPVNEVNDPAAYVRALRQMMDDTEGRIARSISLRKRIEVRHTFVSYAANISRIIEQKPND